MSERLPLEWEDHVGLVWKLAQPYFKYLVDDLIEPEDLVQQGMFGLKQALDRFDPDRGVKFSSYAKLWIERAIRDALDQRHMMGESAHQHQRQIEAAEDAFFVEQGRTPSVRELARATGLSKAIVLSVKQMHHVRSQGSHIPDYVDPQEVPFWRERLQDLPPELKTLMILRHGIYDHCERRLKDVGRILGLSRERVRQKENDAIDLLLRG